MQRVWEIQGSFGVVEKRKTQTHIHSEDQWDIITLQPGLPISKAQDEVLKLVIT